MATTQDYIEYVAEQVADLGVVRYRKMFGEYLLYVDERPILLVVDNQVFVKILPCLDELMRNAGRSKAYEGSAEHYILDIEERDLVREVVGELKKVVSIKKPKPKKK